MTALVAPYLAALWIWTQAHPLLALGIAASILGTLANSLSHFPRAQAAVANAASVLGAVLRFALDVMAVVANARGTGIAGPVTVPGVPTLPSKDAAAKLAGPLLLLLAVAASGCGYISAEKKAEIKSDEKACFASLGQDEIDKAKADAVATLTEILGDPTVSDKAATALAEVWSLSKTGALDLLKCGEIALLDLLSPVRPEFAPVPAAPPPDLGAQAAAFVTSDTYAPQCSQVETPQERAKRRARAHLATLASQWAAAVAVP